MELKSSTRQYELLLFIFLTSFYLLTAVGYVSTSMGVTAYETAKSLVEEGDLALNQPTLETGIGKDGKYYTYEGLGFILIVTIFFTVTRFFGVHPSQWGIFTNQILTPIACVLLYLLGRELKYSKKTSTLLALIYGIGTMAWAHARYLMPEPLTTVVYLAAFLSLLKYKNRRQSKWLILCSCLTGLTLMIRSDAPLFVFGMSIGVLILLYGEYRKNAGEFQSVLRKGLLFITPLILCSGIYVYYNYARFGDIFELGYSTKAEVVEESVGGEKAHEIVGIGDSLLGFAGMWFIPCRSMFFINPILIFIFWALKDFWKKYRFESITIGVLFVIHVLIYSNRGPGGFPGSSAWGIRYMVPMTSFMVIVMGVFVEKVIAQPKKSKLLRFFILVLTVSVLFQYIGASMNYQVTQGRLEDELRTSGDKWAARWAMNLDPKWNLITQNVKWLRQGQADFMYYNYLTRGDFISHPRERRDDAPGWVWPSLFLLLASFGASGYMLAKRLFTTETIPVKSEKGKRKKKKR